jgi:hypothetical protein
MTACTYTTANKSNAVVENRRCKAGWRKSLYGARLVTGGAMIAAACQFSEYIGPVESVVSRSVDESQLRQFVVLTSSFLAVVCRATRKRDAPNNASGFGTWTGTCSPAFSGCPRRACRSSWLERA